jgi:Carbohydrate-selective porin, OprB family/S-layer homology domain
MSNIFWKALKISPAFLGASLLVASSTYAAQNLPTQTAETTAETPVTVAPVAQEATIAPVAQTKVVASTTPATQAIPQATAITAQPTVEAPVEQAQQPQTLARETPSQLAQQAPAANTNQTLDQINRYTNEGNSTTIDQVTNVSQLRDVSPGDWAFEALRSLVERYGCIAGYPDGTFRGNRATSRFEFAAGLNACLNQVERLIQTSTADFVRKSDLETLQRLVTEFRTELTTLGARVDKLDGRVGFLEARQFSTTTKLNAEAIFNIGGIYGGGTNRLGRDYTGTNTVFDDRVRLNFDTSFTGKDRLRTRLQAGNITEFGPLTGSVASGAVTREGRFGFQRDTGNSVELEKLWYRTPINNFVTAHLFANAGNYDDFVPLLNGNLDASGTGALSRFGRYNPIYRIGGQNAGAGLTIGAKSPIRIDLGYLAGQSITGTSTSGAADPGNDGGLFNGSYSALGQVTFQPAKQFALSATYIHSYGTNPDSITGNGALGGSLGHGTGSIASQVGNTFRPVVGNSFGLGASFSFTPKVTLSGWAGYTEAIVLQAGRADVWNFGATLALNDFGTKGSTLGLIFGMEPKLTGTSNANVANLISAGSLPVGARRDQDTGFHIEGFYKFNVTRNIAITPGVIWLTAPGHNNNNDDILIGTVRTTFTF